MIKKVLIWLAEACLLYLLFYLVVSHQFSIKDLALAILIVVVGNITVSRFFK